MKMQRPPVRPIRPRHGSSLAIALLLGLTLVAVGCTGSPTPVPSGPPAGSASLGPRPSSNATVKIVQPASGATITGTSLHIVIDLEGAKIVSATTTAIRPDEGHLHLYVDNALVSMNYALEQDIPVHPGTYVLRVEFVAADHAPFSPRVVSPDIFFTVK